MKIISWRDSARLISWSNEIVNEYESSPTEYCYINSAMFIKTKRNEYRTEARIHDICSCLDQGSQRKPGTSL